MMKKPPDITHADLVDLLHHQVSVPQKVLQAIRVADEAISRAPNVASIDSHFSDLDINLSSIIDIDGNEIESWLGERARASVGRTIVSSFDPMMDALVILRQQAVEEFFLSFKSMLSWVDRCAWTEPNTAWNPSAWLEAASELNCTQDILRLLFTETNAKNNPWKNYLALGQQWDKVAHTWVNAVKDKPDMALTWAEDVLTTPRISLSGGTQRPSGEVRQEFVGNFWGRTAAAYALHPQDPIQPRILKALECVSFDRPWSKINIQSLFAPAQNSKRNLCTPKEAQERLTRLWLLDVEGATQIMGVSASSGRPNINFNNANYIGSALSSLSSNNKMSGQTLMDVFVRLDQLDPPATSTKAWSQMLLSVSNDLLKKHLGAAGPTSSPSRKM